MSALLEKSPADLLNNCVKSRVMIVEDNLISRTFLETQIESAGHTVLHAENGLDAINALKAAPDIADVILMDREMPVMDGLTAVKRIKSEPEFSKIPIIMITGSDTDEAIDEGLNAGVFYYLTKPVREETLNSVLAAAVREVEKRKALKSELSKHQAGFDLMTTFRFELKTIEDANRLCGFIASCFPEPARVVTGICELMINAVEHGNLEIGYELKTQLLQGGNLKREISRRLSLPEYKDRVATVSVVKKEDNIYFMVEDEGKGFDWKKYIRIDPSRAGDSHGRGIALAALSSFDKLQYNDSGTKAIGTVSFQEQLDW